MATKKTEEAFMRVDCPACGQLVTFNEREWMRSIKAVKTGSVKVPSRGEMVETMPQTLTCSACKQEIANREWHRKAEHAAFVAAGLAKAS